jgi:hypothetical protein
MLEIKVKGKKGGKRTLTSVIMGFWGRSEQREQVTREYKSFSFKLFRAFVISKL